MHLPEAALKKKQHTKHQRKRYRVPKKERANDNFGCRISSSDFQIEKWLELFYSKNSVTDIKGCCTSEIQIVLDLQPVT